MKKIKFLIAGFISLFLVTSVALQAQNSRIVSECTIVYNLSVENSNTNAELLQSLNGASKTVYIKGSKSRTDVISPSYTITIFNDNKSDTTVILRDLGAAKYMSYLNETKRQEKNKKYEGITFAPTNETKTILGYECKKVVASLKDGSTYNVYYAPSIIPSNREYEYQFKDLPGLALEYETESEDGKVKYKFVAEKINLSPVMGSKFELPKSGYRIL